MTWDISAHAVEGARFVNPAEYLEHKNNFLLGTLVGYVLTDALVAAADPDGIIENFNVVRFYTQHVATTMRTDDDGSDYQLTYDRFTAMSLMEHLHGLVEAGLLAHRGKGDSYDYRLALPEQAS